MFFQNMRGEHYFNVILDLSHNQLVSLPKNMYQALAGSRSFDPYRDIYMTLLLDHNKLTSFEWEVGLPPPMLQQLELASNNIHCDMAICETVRFFTRYHLYGGNEYDEQLPNSMFKSDFQGYATCSSPSHLTNKKLICLTNDDIPGCPCKYSIQL